MPINVYSREGQAVFLVLYALRELGGVCAKQEVLRFIENSEFYDLTHHDLPPYENQTEPRYHTLLGWARFHAAQMGWLVDPGGRDAWQLSRDGRDVLDRTIQRYRTGELSVRMCYLWTARFKRQIDPTYQPSPDDRVRPEDLAIEFE